MNICNIHYSADINNNAPFLIQEIKDIVNNLEDIVKKFEICFQDMKSIKKHVLLMEKLKVFKNMLRKLILQVCYMLQGFITNMAYLYMTQGEENLILILRLSTAHNNLIKLNTTYSLSTGCNKVFNNTCPYIMFPNKEISVTRILKLLSVHRAEDCCHKLIDCLLETYRMSDSHNSEDGSSSEDSSIEIYMALTKHLTPPLENLSQSLTNKEKSTINDDESVGRFANIEKLISFEEQYAINLLQVTQKTAPALLDSALPKCSKVGNPKLITRVTAQALEYYEQILWAEVGNYLEHVILWWATCPLYARPPRSAQHLREWINNLVSTASIPSVILSALTSLADALGLHVALTLWDQNFREVLITTKSTYNSHTGQSIFNLLQELVVLSNLCEVTTDWIIGAPLDELPLVEQIPVLHRLDHSIHTTRLWVINECRSLANNWSVKEFFEITHVNTVNFLSVLTDLRLNDHSMDFTKKGLDVQIKMCALMRAKLKSEVKVNIEKLKETPDKCVDCLASICKIINLANLQMVFPNKLSWKLEQDYEIAFVPNNYVKIYLDKMLLPVIKSTDNDSICNMVLTLICESWLDHIYNNKIKFSPWGALQLLCDFGYVTIWIQDCDCMTDQMKKQLLKNEVLRRCEGVGKLLLRRPGERLKMTAQNMRASEDDNNQHHQMPAEMYVPNQEQWLELRAVRPKSGWNPLCK
ncbi:uncharacterized protein LOC126740468 [Anthonomus grandis grandis]|uniref:uncharacterized protein LOC126740468 n=1 Tax=Anthonomus grandis grandis TaxID=2921223 RepID=UPI002165560A|nr:uncharacterized protein LOC126740468 [Anthonomus grandis grandis]